MSGTASQPGNNASASSAARRPDQELDKTHVSRGLLQELEKDLDEATSQLEDQAKSVATDDSRDVDSWVTRVNRVQADLEKSKETARSIVQQAKEHEALGKTVTDASNKVELLEKELAFNTSLEAALEELQSLYRRLGKAKDLVVSEQTVAATGILRDVQQHLDKLRSSYPSNAIRALESRASAISGDVIDTAQKHLCSCFKVTKEPSTIDTSLKHAKQGDAGFSETVETLQQLGALDHPVTSIKRSLETAFFQPWSRNDAQRPASRVKVSADKLWMDPSTNSASVVDVLCDVAVLVEFTSTNLPQIVCQRLSELVMPEFIEQLETHRLNPNVPVETEQLTEFDKVLVAVKALSETLVERSWDGHARLDEWVENAPKVWLARQREHALDSIRISLLSRLGERKEAEKVEAEAIEQEDADAAEKAMDKDPWDTEWNDNTRPTGGKDDHNDEADDSSAWEQDNDTTQDGLQGAAESDEQDAAWGWDDDNSPRKADRQASSAMKPGDTSNRKTKAHQEKYTVTGVPEALLEQSIAIFRQAKAMREGGATDSAVGAAIPGLSNLPTLAMALYRAMAVTAYDKIENGKLLLFNDSSWMAEHIRALSDGSQEGGHELGLSSAVARKLEQEVIAFDRFAKLAHGAEMESQKTIVRDLLDGAQGFANCTTAPFAEECENAVSMTVDRIRVVHGQWRGVLSRSALHKSTGSLLSTVVSKYIMDIEDLADIGEDESKRLVAYCKSLSSVNDLFAEQHPDTLETRDMTPVYCRNWLKLQYLGEMLEGSLADIKYLWKEGELSIEFDADEVADLIRALFADSEHRRKAIAEIVRR